MNAVIDTKKFSDFKVADLALYPAIVGRRELIAKAGTMPNLLKWMDRMAARPAAQKAYAS
jgi:glutathione S-transferase